MTWRRRYFEKRESRVFESAIAERDADCRMAVATEWLLEAVRIASHEFPMRSALSELCRDVNQVVARNEALKMTWKNRKFQKRDARLFRSKLGEKARGERRSKELDLEYECLFPPLKLDGLFTLEEWRRAEPSLRETRN
jgi:hypothetical protein